MGTMSKSLRCSAFVILLVVVSTTCFWSLQGCASSMAAEIARQQALVTRLTVQCRQGHPEACRRLDGELPQLRRMVQDRKEANE